MGITNAQAAKINKSMRANQDVSLGTIIQALQAQASTTGSVLVSSAQVSASAVSINTGQTGITWFETNLLRSGSPLVSYNVYNSGSILLISNNTSASFVLAENDKIYWEVI
jgi:hypothetical protein